ncbi:MAG: hypothetical protein HY959_03690 [Ignavibacteriae bacterium]|nr:hypothetical protein [Ignavibacteriota bacterium]
MATKFYRKGKDFYNADNHQYISATQFGTGKDYQEVTIPKDNSVVIPNPSEIKNYDVTGKSADGKSLLGIPKIKPLTNNSNTSTLDIGLKTGNITAQMPENTADAIHQVEIDNAKKFNEGANATLSIFQQQLKDAETRRKEIESSISSLEAERETMVSKRYEELSKPFRAQMEELGNTEFQLKEKYKKYSELANSLTNYADIAYNDIVAEQNRPALLSVSQGRVSNIKEDYNTKITLTKTAMAALSDDIALGRTFIDRGISAVVADRNDELNYLQFINGLIDQKLLTLTDEKKTAISDIKEANQSRIETIQSEFKRIDEEKTKVQDFLLENADVSVKAGVILSDDYKTMVEKVSTFLSKNPQYNPEQVSILKEWILNFPDAGISFNDSIEIAQQKLLRSNSYKKSQIKGSGSNKETITFQSAMEDTAQYLIDLRRKGKLTDLSYSQAISAFMSDFDIPEEQRGAVQSQINNIMQGSATPQQIESDNNPTSDFIVDYGSSIAPVNDRGYFKEEGGFGNVFGRFLGLKDSRVSRLANDYPNAGITNKDTYQSALNKINQLKRSGNLR